MAVLITAEVPGQTPEGYDGMMSVLGPAIRQAKGFIATGAGAGPDGWRVFEIWETEEDGTQFFAKFVHPNLPPGVKPRRTILELHAFVTPDRA